jgi:hypothetical protein
MTAATEVLRCSRGWPDGAGSAVAIDLLGRWSRAKRNRISHHLGVPDRKDAWNPGSTGSNRPFKRGFESCWNLLVRVEASDSAINNPILAHESGAEHHGKKFVSILLLQDSGTHCGQF